MIKLRYEDLMEEQGLDNSDLNDEAKEGIKSIKAAVRFMEMNKSKRGVDPSKSALKKVATLDKWVCNEIMDIVYDRDTNDDTPPVDGDELIDEIKSDADDKPSVDPKGLKIEQELQEMWDSGDREFDLDAIREKTKTAYSVIFESYEDGEENGIRTSKFELIETSDEVFTLKKR